MTRAATVSRWIALLASTLAATATHAEAIYKCRNADGSVAYQSKPCTQAQRAEVAPRISAGPPVVARQLDARERAERGPTIAEGELYRCRRDNGEIYVSDADCSFTEVAPSSRFSADGMPVLAPGSDARMLMKRKPTATVDWQQVTPLTDGCAEARAALARSTDPAEIRRLRGLLERNCRP